MKTFEEAFQTVIDKPGVLEELRSLPGSPLDNNLELWRDYIHALAVETLVTVGTDPEYSIGAVICSSLHNAFSMGLLTGITMERREG